MLVLFIYLRYIVAPDQTLLASIRYYVTSYFKRSSFQAIVRYKICGNRVKKNDNWFVCHHVSLKLKLYE